MTTQTRFIRTSRAAALLAVSLLAFSAGPRPLVAAQEGSTKTEPASAEKLARGKYLVTTSGCNDCHTPWKMGANGPEPDMSRMLSGHPEQMALPPAPKLPEGPWLVTVAATNTAWSGPWGVSFTANLTPDRETGLGKWTLRNFTDTIRTGRHMGRGRPILPPMPIPMYKHFNDGDLESIFSYLQSIPAVKNRVPEPLPPMAATEERHINDAELKSNPRVPNSAPVKTKRVLEPLPQVETLAASSHYSTNGVLQ